MNARDQLLELYEAWRTLSEDEGAAIRQSDWARLSRCQAAKLGLQVRIITAGEKLDRETTLGRPAAPGLDAGLRAVLDGLIRLEARNGEWLAERRREARVESLSLECAARNLRQVRQAYAPGLRSAWHSRA
jgi:hypothetical protein